MELTREELEKMAANITMSDALSMAEILQNDPTAHGAVVLDDDGEPVSINVERFNKKWCSWWFVAKIILKLAKKFTGDRIDRIIDKLLEFGNENCR